MSVSSILKTIILAVCPIFFCSSENISLKTCKTSMSASDSLHKTTIELQQERYEQDEMGSLFLLVIGTAMMLFCFGIGVSIAFLFFLLVAASLAFGVLSISLAVAWYQKSLTSGFKTLTLVSFSILGSISACVFTSILFQTTHWAHLSESLLFAALGGVLAGLLFGYLFIYSVRTLGKKLLNKISNPR